MTVSGPHEDLSVSEKENKSDNCCVSGICRERESVSCAYISESGISSCVSADVLSGQVRSGYEARFDELYPVEGLHPFDGESLSSLCRQMRVAGDTSCRLTMFLGDTRRDWYVFRLNYGRGLKDIEKTAFPDCTFYVPVIERKVKKKGGETVIVRETYLDNLVFAYTTRAVAEVVHNSPLLPTVRFYYNHFQVDSRTGYDTPLTVPRAKMLDFMLIAEARSFDKRIIDPAKTVIKPGSRVEITDGPFKGVRGILTRVAGKQRVVVDTGFALLATGYVTAYGCKVVE